MSGTPERTRYCSRCLTTFPGDAARCPNLGCRAARPAVGWGELLEEGAVLDRTYKIHARLAIGGAGVTYLAGELGPEGMGEVGPRVAIKVLYQQRDQGPYLRRLSTEAQILQGLNHPQIVECRGFVQRSGHSPYLVTRYEEGGSLLDHIRRVGTLGIEVTAGIGRQVCWALDVAHHQGVVHRDLKPENVLLVRPVVADAIPELRVADFGIAKVYGGVGDRLTRVGAFVGTPQYAAPEQFEGLAPEPATDVYAVGALLYFCMMARPVADHMAELDPESQREHLVRHLPPRLDPTIGTPETRRWMEDTLAIAMAVDPGDRCDISQLDARLAAIHEGRDPGFVRLPPAQGTYGAGGGLAPVRTADTLDTAHVRPLVTEEVPEPSRSGGARGAREVTSPDRTSSRTITMPLPAPAPPRPVARSQAPLGCGLAALGVGLVALVFAAAAAWMFAGQSPTVLTGTETEPDALEDWRLVAGTLGEKGVVAEAACGSPPYLAVEVVVEGDGALRSAALLNYPHEPTRACIERELTKTRFPRSGEDPVKVAVTLQK